MGVVQVKPETKYELNTKRSKMGFSPANIDGYQYFIIQYRNRFGKKKQICLPKGTSRKRAEYHDGFVMNLVEYSKNPTLVPDAQTLLYVKELDSTMRKKLIKHGLIQQTEEEKKSEAMPVYQLCDIFEDRYRLGNENTYKNVKQTCDMLRRKFGEKKYIDITEDELKKWNDRLYGGIELNAFGKPYSAPTISRHVKRFRQIHRFAAEKGFIPSDSPNKFRKGVMEIKKMSNPLRVKNIDKNLFEQVISVCENDELRFALWLGRYASFRLFSEAYRWRWSFIDFKEEKFLIRRKDVNTEERYTTMPMISYFYAFFDELLKYYKCEAYIKDSEGMDLSQIERLLIQNGNKYVSEMVKRFPPKQDFVFSERFRSRKNRRGQVKKLLKKAKIEENDWLKVTHNLRSSCVRDMVKMFGPVIAPKICGHGIEVAVEHYLTEAEEEQIKRVLKGNVGENQDIQTIRTLIDKYGLKRFEEMVIKATKN